MARTQPQASYANIRENISQKRFDFKPDIDLRGMRGEEALQKVITFLDEAVMLNYKEVRLLHGTGTGALRQLIRQYLSTNPLVASFGDEQIQLGGAGITVVKLDIEYWHLIHVYSKCRIILLPIRLRCSCLGTRSLLSVV